MLQTGFLVRSREETDGHYVHMALESEPRDQFRTHGEDRGTPEEETRGESRSLVGK